VALADYFDRGAQAVSQVVFGFDSQAFSAQVGALDVGVSFGSDAASSREGQAALDLTVRLLARFYPAIAIVGPASRTVTELSELALAINPKIDVLHDLRPVHGLVFGKEAERFRSSVYVGSSAWLGSASTRMPLSFGSSTDPFGAGVAAALGTGLLFRAAVLGQDIEGERAQLSARRDQLARRAPPRSGRDLDAVLVGAGAIGNAVAWALARSRDRGSLAIVDHETVELSNLQRYVMTERSSTSRAKSRLLADSFGAFIEAIPFEGTWGDFALRRGVHNPRLMLALDSAGDRRAAQASLPRWIANAWTQPGDLGVSEHSAFGGPGACVACLYHPAGVAPNEDELVARALGVPDRLAQVRTLLHLGRGLEPDFLEAVAAALGRPIELFAPFAGQPVRELYVQGICGGAVLPLGSSGTVRADVHVPLAHQSALAGVLLAARLVESSRTGVEPEVTQATTIDVIRPIPPIPSRPIRASPGCFCRDGDYRTVYRTKWSLAH